MGYGTSAIGTEAVIWDANGSMVRVADFLAANGTRVPPGWILQSATGIAINGNVMTLVGMGNDLVGDSEAWMATAVLSERDIHAGHVEAANRGSPPDASRAARTGDTH